VAWGVVDMTLSGGDGTWGVVWGWKWLTEAEAAANDGLSPPHFTEVMDLMGCFSRAGIPGS